MKETIHNKYKRIFPKIKHGDTILFYGTNCISGIIVDILGVFYVVYCNDKKACMNKLSVIMNNYKEIDFVIRRSFKSEEEIEETVCNTIYNVDLIGLEYVSIIKSLIKKWFITKPNKKKLTSSEFVHNYELELEMVMDIKINNSLIFPEDFEGYDRKVIDIC